MNKKQLNFIEYKGYKYWYEQKTAKHRVDICLATKQPKEYCNGFYLYSDKDPSNGTPFVVIKTNNPNFNLKNHNYTDANNVLAVRSCALAKDDMGDDLCRYCSLGKKGVYGVDGGYMAGCEGSRCDDAYDNYLESIGE